MYLVIIKIEITKYIQQSCYIHSCLKFYPAALDWIAAETLLTSMCMRRLLHSYSVCLSVSPTLQNKSTSRHHSWFLQPLLNLFSRKDLWQHMKVVVNLRRLIYKIKIKGEKSLIWPKSTSGFPFKIKMPSLKVPKTTILQMTLKTKAFLRVRWLIEELLIYVF